MVVLLIFIMWRMMLGNVSQNFIMFSGCVMVGLAACMRPWSIVHMRHGMQGTQRNAPHDEHA